MASIVTYDIPEKHREFKQAMFRLGYKEKIAGESCNVIFFPNTTLYHENKSPAQARDDVKAMCKNLDVELERCIATIWENWAVVCGEPFS